MQSSVFIFTKYIVFLWIGLLLSAQILSTSHGSILVIGKFYKTYMQPWEVLPLPVIANIIGDNYDGNYLDLIWSPISLRWA